MGIVKTHNARAGFVVQRQAIAEPMRSFRARRHSLHHETDSICARRRKSYAIEFEQKIKAMIAVTGHLEKVIIW